MPKRKREVWRCECRLPGTRPPPVKNTFRARLLPDGRRFSEDPFVLFPDAGAPAAASCSRLAVQRPQNLLVSRAPSAQSAAAKKLAAKAEAKAEAQKGAQGWRQGQAPARCPLERSPPAPHPVSMRHHRPEPVVGRTPLPSSGSGRDHPGDEGRNGAWMRRRNYRSRRTPFQKPTPFPGSSSSPGQPARKAAMGPGDGGSALIRLIPVDCPVFPHGPEAAAGGVPLASALPPWSSRGLAQPLFHSGFGRPLIASQATTPVAAPGTCSPPLPWCSPMAAATIRLIYGQRRALASAPALRAPGSGLPSRLTAEASSAQGAPSFAWPRPAAGSHQRLQRHSHRQPGRRFRIEFRPRGSGPWRNGQRVRPAARRPAFRWWWALSERGLPAGDCKAFRFSPFWRWR